MSVVLVHVRDCSLSVLVFMVPAVATSVLLVAGVLMAILCVRTNSRMKTKKKKEALRVEEEEKELLVKQRKKSQQVAMQTRVNTINEVELAPLKPTQNGGTQEPPPPVPTTKPPPPPITTEEAEDKELEVRTPKESTGDRPLSWDKSADELPLIIGTQQETPQEEAEDSASEGSSFDCTIDITGSPSSSAVFPPQRVRRQPSVSPGSSRNGAVREGHRAKQGSDYMTYETERRNSDVALETGSRSLVDSIESLIQKLTVSRVKSEGDCPLYMEQSLWLSDINLDVLKRKVDIRIVPSLSSMMGSATDVMLPPEQLRGVCEEPRGHDQAEHTRQQQGE
ncbi:hypothetical protein GWK47_035055 [Chionoecetes opilio]|uniref:Uncharacterized protein n=1 Tax=Chionoecetes opilio TaxID=41210 RepID=A0A8J4YFP9_CHIOP|nr:hypothetical protein GWK47_035055 [Chionoecetes opilio]